jgi:carbamoylphosphate synthase large subunit
MTYNNGSTNQQRLAILYEHPEWFKPLFAELDLRSVPYDRLLAHKHQFEPRERKNPYSLIINRMSPSAFTRDHTQGILYTLEYLEYLKIIGANVIHGYDTYLYEISKARQLNLLENLGLPYPRALVINHASQALSAAKDLVFPIIIKSNIGGSGAGIQKFESLDELQTAMEEGTIDFGIHHLALVQEYLPARDNSIIRVEVLNGKFLYAIRLFLTKDTFNLCPADYCDIPEIETLDGDSKPSVLVETYNPPQEIIETVERITAAAQIEVGGVEYLINDRNGEVYYYDINALSNFVADAPNIIGFDPFPKLVDFLLVRAGLGVPA